MIVRDGVEYAENLKELAESLIRSHENFPTLSELATVMIYAGFTGQDRRSGPIFETVREWLERP